MRLGGNGGGWESTRKGRGEVVENEFNQNTLYSHMEVSNNSLKIKMQL